MPAATVDGFARSKRSNVRTKIIPAVLQYGRKQIQREIDRCHGLGDGLHLDIVDGTLYAPRPNLTPSDLRLLLLPRQTTVHLMVKNPALWIRACYAHRITRIAIHAESQISLAALREIQRLFRLLLVISPGTALASIKPKLDLAEGFLVMTVKPGAQGRNFLPSQLRMIRQLRQQHRRALIAADGGISEFTINDAVQAGANELIVGSALRYSRQPKHTLAGLRRQISVKR